MITLTLSSNFALGSGWLLMFCKEMKRRGVISFWIVGVLVFLSLFPTWNFSEGIRLPQEVNPLWDSDLKPINAALTEALREEGLNFETGRGAEADPDGICYGDFASDEYWVVQYDPVNKEVDAYAWIVGVNWIGHVQARSRFSRIKARLGESIKSK